MIYHISSKLKWNNALEIGNYKVPPLFTKGFIHACTQAQLKGMLDKYYKVRKNILILHIDETKLIADIEFVSSSTDDVAFPHILGVINLDSVVEISILQDTPIKLKNKNLLP